MKANITTKLIEGTIGAVAVSAIASVIFPSAAIAASGVLIAGGLATMAALESKGREY